MPRVRQTLRIITSKRPKKKKGIWISKRSIGTIFINGKPLTYNADLVYKDRDDVSFEEMQEDAERKRRKKKVIIIRKR